MTAQPTKKSTHEPGKTIPGSFAQELLTNIATWGNVTTIVIHLGSVFEFKGPFPKGSDGFGFYNLEGPIPGFHGHLNLNDIHHIAFQEKLHRGRESFALVFNNSNSETVFKVFLGRDDQGEVLKNQLTQFSSLKDIYG